MVFNWMLDSKLAVVYKYAAIDGSYIVIIDTVLESNEIMSTRSWYGIYLMSWLWWGLPRYKIGGK